MTPPEDDPTGPPDAATPDEAPTGSVLDRAGQALPSFAPGDVVAGRYRIVRFVAQGGMGQVHEAEDLDLRERVALKTIRPETAADGRALERFRREILLARKVTHPNVCRIFDLGTHRAPGAGPITFLTMELLAGESLSERLRRARRLSTSEALPLALQVASALGAAHRAGVVHRDLKPSNVILVSAGAGEARAVVTDFGLARTSATDPKGETSMTETGFTLGTAAYMSPEQVEGGPVTPASDLYSLGVVLYEMITGTRPFAGETPLSTAVKRLKEAPPSPRSRVPDLDPRWEAAILRCLARDPARRFASAEDLARFLAGEAPARERLLRRPGVRAAAAAGVVVILAAGAYRLARPRQAGRPAASAPPGATAVPASAKARRSVAVLGFRNVSGRPDVAWLSTALSEMLTTELAAGEKLRTVPGENVGRLKADLALADADSLAADTLARIRALLGTDIVVLGAYVALGSEASGQIRLDLRMQDTARGEILGSVAEQGTEADLFGLVSRAGARLRERLGVGELSQAEAGAVRASTVRPECYRFYCEGLAKLRLLDALAARALLEQAAASEPDYAPAHAALAEAWSALGYEGRAREEARKAFDLSGKLSREERLATEGRYREASREWEKAVEVYRTLYGFFPDNLEYGLRLAAAQTSARHGTQALATVESLRRLPPPASEDPRIDIAEAQAAAAATDFRRQQAAAASAARKGAQRGSRLLAARAQLEEAAAFVNLGRLDEAAEAAEKARDGFAAAEDGGGVAEALFNLAAARWQQGRLAEAQKAARAALEGFRGIGNKSREAWVLNRLAVVLHYAGELAKARTTFDAALARFREVGDKGGEAAIAINLARLLRDQGDLPGARRRHDEALALSREVGNRNYLAHALFGLGETSMAAGDLAGARKAHEEALAVWSELGRQGPVGESHAALASILVEEGRAGEAEPLARRAVAEFHEQGSVFNEAHAQAVLARALLAEGKLAEAREAALRAVALAERTEHRVFRLETAITSAVCRARSGKPAAAVTDLEAAASDARRSGLPGLEWEARLALGEIEIRSGDAAAGRSGLGTLEREARARGFGLIARKAAAARG